MKIAEKYLLIILIIITSILVFIGLVSLFLWQSYSGKLFSTAGLVLSLAGFIQLEISGLFDRISKEYDDLQKYPFGPPSFITRKIINNIERPFMTFLTNKLFVSYYTGFYLIIIGIILQALGVWI
ncbi:MAG: hypothetical protein FJ128_10095 [Deltaproteobacteria bacterium]|nr:hypothetical protein [Deltaproteobacteria bacterium]